MASRQGDIKRSVGCVSRQSTRQKFRFVNWPGWHGDGFVLPGKFFCSRPNATQVVIDPESVKHVGEFLIGEGGLREWQTSVAKRARKASPIYVAIAAAFAAPLLRKLNMDSFAINWFGATSEGKSLTLKVAASVGGLFGPGGTLRVGQILSRRLKLS